MKIKSLIFPLVFLFVFSGCQKSVFQSLKKADDLFVYEGLPHPLRENPIFEKEKKRDDIKQIKNHWFYDAKVKATGKTRDQLMNLLFYESGFSSLDHKTPPKDCGPFHPDYAIMWKSDGDGVENYLMICFTCSEGKLFRERKTKTYNLIESWENLLGNFKANRPR